MTIIEQLKNFVQDLTAPYSMGFKQVNEETFVIFLPDVGVEVARAFFNSQEGHFGLQFHTAIPPMDAIRIYNTAKELLPELILYYDYFIDPEGNIYFGIDARALADHHKESVIAQQIEKQHQAKAEEEWLLKHIDSRKITFH